MRPRVPLVRLVSLIVLVVLAVAVPALLPEAAAQTPTREWTRPYPAEHPTYWELLGRLYGEFAQANQVPLFDDVTAPAALSVADVPVAAPLRETVFSSVVFTFNLNSENALKTRPRLVVRDTAEVRVVLTPLNELGVELRTGSSSDRHQDCIDSQMPALLGALDARWQAVNACARAVTWSAWRDLERLPVTGGSFVVDGATALDITYDASTKRARATPRLPKPGEGSR